MASEEKRTENVPEEEEMLPVDEKAEMEKLYSEMPITEETACGFWIFKSDKFQRFANKKMFVLIFGLAGCVFSSTFSYFNGSITTIEKRFKFSSKVTGVILVGNDITKLVFSVFLNYYASKGHKPRWIALGLYCVALFCFLNTIPHFIYGSGTDALQLTYEYGSNFTSNVTENFQNKILCEKKDDEECNLEDGSLIPPIILFISQLIAGVGGTLYYSLGYSYMDDNIKKTKSPTIITFSYFIRMLGPALGYAVSSACLNYYISPSLTPAITNSDPRWLGAWWVGWIILGIILTFFTTCLAMFPHTLPRAAARKEYIRQKSNASKVIPEKPSLSDMKETLKRLMKNKAYVYYQLNNMFCAFGFNPYWTYLPKYIEFQYSKSASVANFATGSVGLVFVALGIFLGGVIVQTFKPRARYMAIWNAIADFIIFLGFLAYSFLGCPAADNQIKVFESRQLEINMHCNADCYCDYVKFSPVCSIETSEMFISACHAGCTQKTLLNESIIFTNCSCIPSPNKPLIDGLVQNYGGSALPGPCPLDCDYYFYSFMTIVCLVKLFGAMSRITLFLVSVRCVEERDKSVSLAVSLAAVSVFSLIPSPILFGYIIDSACLVWGKTCTGTGNCWFFNSELLRKRLSYTAAAFYFVGVFFTIFLIRNLKNVNMFDKVEEIDDQKVGEKSKSVEKSKETKS